MWEVVSGTGIHYNANTPTPFILILALFLVLGIACSSNGITGKRESESLVLFCSLQSYAIMMFFILCLHSNKPAWILLVV